MKPLVLFFCLLGVLSCDKYAEKVWSIKIKNNSEKDVWYYLSYKLPDTSFEMQRPQSLSRVKSKQLINIDNPIKWEEIIDTIPGKKLAIFILNDDTLKAYSWDAIRNRYAVLKRYDLSASELKDLNWTIQYQ